MSQYKHLVRVALLALPLLLLLGLNGRTVTLLRPADAPAQLSPRATVIKQRVVLEAASPLAPSVAPLALGWLPNVLPTGWLPRLVRRAVVTAAAEATSALVALGQRLRLLRAAVQAQAP